MASRKNIMRLLILTFDTEDFINPNAIDALYVILQILNKYRLKAIFFITGHMAEKLSNLPIILDQLKKHTIGFHSSSHSVRPTIPEYADVKNYNAAYSISLERETSHINPLTGKIERDGGIYFLQDLFYKKKIEAFRAPGMSWTPTHLEALVDLGIKYDFSSDVTNSVPIRYRRVTFYPYTFIQKWGGSLSDHKCLLSALLKRNVAVFNLHPTQLANQYEWDKIFFKGNPSSLLKTRERSPNEVKTLFNKFELLLKEVTFLRRTGLIDVEPNFSTQNRNLLMSQNEVEKCYQMSMRWPKNLFNYHPKFIYDHFCQFFEQAINNI